MKRVHYLARHPGISDRQREILQWVADGDAYKQIAGRLAVPYHVVQREVKSAQHALGCNNPRHTIAVALRAGEIY